MIKVLVVEDSPVVQEFLIHVLGSDPEIRVIGTASNGEEAIEALKKERPDLVTMDIHMPKMNGLEATRKIMETTPIPIIVLSGSVNCDEIGPSFQAMEAGALAFVQRPTGPGHPAHLETSRDLIQTVKLMSEVKVVRRWARPQGDEKPLMISALRQESVAPTLKSLSAEVRLVAIGASTGGPLVVQRILSGLPKEFSAPIVIVQHMAPGFIQGFADWLGQSSGFPVHVASHGEILLPGHVYVGPDGFHMCVQNGSRIELNQDDPENGLRPAVSQLFRSVASVYGSRAVGVLLTGMGKDGAEELKLMKTQGALTIVQDKDSSVVHGMPGHAILLGASTYVLPPDRIAALLSGLVETKKQSSCS